MLAARKTTLSGGVTSVLERLFTPWPRRDLNGVAGILDLKGGIRTVVERPAYMHYHLTADERLFVVPDLWYFGDVPWEEIPDVILAAQQHIFRQTNGQHGSLDLR